MEAASAAKSRKLSALAEHLATTVLPSGDQLAVLLYQAFHPRTALDSQVRVLVALKLPVPPGSQPSSPRN